MSNAVDSYKSELESATELIDPKIEIIHKYHGPDKTTDGWEHIAWTITLKYNGRTFVTDYKTGLGWVKIPTVKSVVLANKRHAELLATPKYVKKPTVADVLSCFLIAGAIEAKFSEWCADFGYSDDSIKAKEIFESQREKEIEIKRFLGSDLWEKLRRLSH